MWFTHIMEYYTALKRKEILTGATTWVKLEDIMLNKIIQSQRYKYSMCPLTSVAKFIETESRMIVAQGWRRAENGELVFNGYRVSVWEDERVRKMDSGDSFITM